MIASEGLAQSRITRITQLIIGSALILLHSYVGMTKSMCEAKKVMKVNIGIGQVRGGDGECKVRLEIGLENGGNKPIWVYLPALDAIRMDVFIKGSDGEVREREKFETDLSSVSDNSFQLIEEGSHVSKSLILNQDENFSAELKARGIDPELGIRNYLPLTAGHYEVWARIHLPKDARRDDLVYGTAQGIIESKHYEFDYPECR